MHTRSASSPLMGVNSNALDELVLEYLVKEELIEADGDDGAAAAVAAGDSALAGKLAALAAHQQLCEGHAADAIAIVARYCPDALQDQRLAFKLKRQQFVELLRRANAAGDAAALACARDDLAPLALDAYPEAYLDFKHALLMLVQAPGEPPAQGAAGDRQAGWSLQARQQLAEALRHTVLQQSGWTTPRLSQLLAYLLHLFEQYKSGSGGGGGGGQAAAQLLAASGAELVPGLLSEGRDEGPLPPDISGRGHVERDVQALMAAVGIPRQQALDALKAAGGDAVVALRRQLARFRLNTSRLDVLAWEYAASRGLVEPDEGAGAGAAAAAAAAPADMEVDAAAPAGGPQAAAALPADAAAATHGQAPAAPGASGGSPFTSPEGAGPAAAVDGCSSAAAASTERSAAAMLRSESQSPPYKVPRWRSRQTPSRFCGQAPLAAAGGGGGAEAAERQQERQRCGSREQQQQQQQLKGSPGKQTPPPPPPSTQQQTCRTSGAEAGGSAGDAIAAEQLVQAARQEQQQRRWQQLQQQLKSQEASSGAASRQAEVQQSLLQLHALVRDGGFAEVEQLVEELQPGLLQEHPAVRFELKRCQFVKLVQGNELPAALQLARSQLTPLADAHPELLPSLKSSMALLLPGALGGGGSSSSGSGGGGHNSSSLLAQLLPLLQARLGLEPPRLVRLLRVLAAGHKAWFKLQRCSDPFAADLGLDKLLQPDAAGGEPPDARPPGAPAAAAPLDAAGAAGGAAAGVDADMLDLGVEEDSGGDNDDGPEVDEAAVLQVMEVLELPRAAALALLAEQGGDAQAVILQVFGM